MNIIPNLSVDCVIFGVNSENLSVLLVERELTKDGEVLFSDHTLTGHHVIEGENTEDAAIRVLKSITGFENIYLEQFNTFSDTNRLGGKKDIIWRENFPHKIAEHVISVGYYSLVDSTAICPDEAHKNVHWFPIDNLPELGFDHKEIIEKALEQLRIKVMHEPVVFELLPEKFTISQLQKLSEAILGTTFDRRNFRKKVGQMKSIIALDEKQKGVAHKPAQIYIFSKDVYERTRKEKLIFFY